MPVVELYVNLTTNPLPGQCLNYDNVTTHHSGTWQYVPPATSEWSWRQDRWQWPQLQSEKSCSARGRDPAAHGYYTVLIPAALPLCHWWSCSCSGVHGMEQ